MIENNFSGKALRRASVPNASVENGFPLRMVPVVDRMRAMRVLLLGNGTKPGILETVALLRPEIERRAEIVGSDFYGQDELPPNNADLAIVFGGDGSILRAVHQMGRRQIPVLAVHLGTLSFLSTVRTDELIPLLDRPGLMASPVIEHLLLRCEVFRKGNRDEPESSRILLNEVLIAGHPASGIAYIELHIDGELVTTYRGDGLILSTPVGSTAHNLSVGGPILRKDVDAVVISPVGPHTLSNRPLVDSPNRCFELAVKQPITLLLDGTKVAVIEPGDMVRVQRAEQTFKTLDVPGYCYYRTLRVKLGWNGSLIGD